MMYTDIIVKSFRLDNSTSLRINDFGNNHEHRNES